MKVLLNDTKSGKSYQKEFDSDLFIGKKIGEKIEGTTVGLADYEFMITGGSDTAGFPHRKDIEGSARKRALISSGVGIRIKLKKGIKIRRAVVGNTFSNNTAQVSLKVVKYGKDSLAKALGIEEVKVEEKAPAEKIKAEEKPVEKPKEEVKAEVKPVEKKA